ncbi:diguanylate cyclase [Gammaproteobacteria bacterium]
MFNVNSKKAALLGTFDQFRGSMATILSSSSVKTLIRYIPPIYPDTRCAVVLDMFINEQTLFVLPVVDEHHIPVGLVNRNKMLETFSRPYTRELYGRKPILEFIETSPIIVEQDKNIDDVARIVSDTGPQSISDGFIITCEGTYVGMGSGYHLLNAITEQKNANLYQLAHFDALTGLPSRLLFQDRLLQSCSHALRKNDGRTPPRSSVALLFLDLDRFKLVNDSFGHHIGDLLLKEVAQRLLSCVRVDDTVARLGGDEFTIILPRIKNTKDVALIAQKIISTISEPFQLCEHKVFVGVSIGIAIFPADDAEINNLIQKADTALYHAKDSGRNQYQFFTEEMNQAISKRIALERNLRHALENDEFFLLFQPQANIKTGCLDGVEALIRWRHHGNEISPVDFIPFAEETDLIIKIDEWVLLTACRQGKAWQAAGLPAIPIAVNLSMRHLHQANFIERVVEILKETDFDPAWLEFELTESLLMKNVEETIILLDRLKALGVKLSIDDFGTGYSSLSYLQRLPIDTLKIDRSFVLGIDTNGTNLNIIRAIIGLAHGLGLTVIAEGVETEGQLNFLRKQQCDRIQGYLCSRPLIPAMLEQLLSDGYCLDLEQ